MCCQLELDRYNCKYPKYINFQCKYRVQVYFIRFRYFQHNTSKFMIQQSAKQYDNHQSQNDTFVMFTKKHFK